jgi:ankyrin repeat protein
MAQTETMLKGFNYACDLQRYWKFCKKMYLSGSETSTREDLLDALVELYSQILEYQARVICHLSSGPLARAWREIKKSENWEEKKTEIERASEVCKQYITASQDKTMTDMVRDQWQRIEQSAAVQQAILEQLNQIKTQSERQYQDEKERRLMSDLASYYESDKDFNPQSVKGTCKWFFTDDRFCDWRDSLTSNLLWLSAGPGCGKSVLSRSLIDEDHLSTRKMTSTICYFFFKEGIAHRTRGANALSAILHQLFGKNPKLIKHALDSYDKCGDKLSGTFGELWRILTNCAGQDGTGDIICVLDALDECKEKKELINTLVQFYSESKRQKTSSATLKFLVTSRPYDDLGAEFKKLSKVSTYMYFDGDDKSDMISKEINLVIDDKIGEIAGAFSEEAREQISSRLKGKGNRTYLWLRLIFDIIDKSPSAYSKPSSIKELLDKLPSEIDDAYEHILSKSQNKKCAELLLQIVLVATRPLTLDEINVALTLACSKTNFSSHRELNKDLWPADDFKRDVTNLCGLFLSVHHSKLFFIHQTAREFLTKSHLSNKRKSKGWKGRLDICKAHGTVSRICFSYLTLDLPVESAKWEIEQIIDQSRFIQYASLNWASHYVSQDDMGAELSITCARMLCNTTRGQENTWFQVYCKENRLSQEGWTDLILASFLGLKQVSREMLRNENPDVNAEGGYYDTALQAASAEGHSEIVQMLLDHGANVNAKGRRSSTMVEAASVEDYSDIVMMYNLGTNINTASGGYSTALQAASTEGHSEIVQMLLDQGANINAEGGYYGTALQAASAEGHSEIVQMLLDRGANVNAEGGRYSNVLEAAASTKGNSKIVQMLLDKGANINANGKYDSTALQVASAQGDSKIVQMLLEKGADVKAEGYYGTALYRASTEGHSEIVQMLLEKGADGGCYGSMLVAASANGHSEIVQILLDQGADVNAEGGIYDTALQAASAKGHSKIVQILLKQGANINTEGGHYGTALQAASAEGHSEIVQMLLDQGANVSAKGGHYSSALQAASAEGYSEIVQMLDQGANGGYNGTVLVPASANSHS